MLLVFETVFSVPVISQIESIGGGGRWGAEGGIKHQFKLKEQYCAFMISK